MDNSDLYNVVIEHKKELEELGYDISEENIENIVNGFIHISNSMVTDESRKKPDIEFGSFILKLSPFKVKFNKTNTNNFNNLLDNNEDNIKIKIKPKYNKDSFNKGLLNIKKENNDKLINDFLDNLSKGNEHLIIDKKISKKQLQDILKDMNLIEKFNKGELTQKENKIITELLNK